MRSKKVIKVWKGRKEGMYDGKKEREKKGKKE